MLIMLVFIVIAFLLLINMALSDQNEVGYRALVGIFLVVGGMNFAILLYEKDIKKDCELSLPRDQYCVIIAIPEQINKTEEK